MIKKTITYTDYNGKSRTEDFYFNLNQAELTEMEVSEEGGMAEMMQRVVKEENMQKLIAIFKDLILRAIGIKSDDGRRFIKNDEIRENFSQTEAYNKLFMELATDADQASKFVNGILPKLPKQEQQKN